MEAHVPCKPQLSSPSFLAPVFSLFFPRSALLSTTLGLSPIPPSHLKLILVLHFLFGKISRLANGRPRELLQRAYLPPSETMDMRQQHSVTVCSKEGKARGGFDSNGACVEEEGTEAPWRRLACPHRTHAMDPIMHSAHALFTYCYIWATLHVMWAVIRPNPGLPLAAVHGGDAYLYVAKFPTRERQRKKGL